MAECRVAPAVVQGLGCQALATTAKLPADVPASICCMFIKTGCHMALFCNDTADGMQGDDEGSEQGGFLQRNFSIARQGHQIKEHLDVVSALCG